MSNTTTLVSMELKYLRYVQVLLPDRAPGIPSFCGINLSPPPLELKDWVKRVGLG